MKRLLWFASIVAVAACSSPGSTGHSAGSAAARAGATAPVGWLNWRGPAQNGTSPETGLIEEVTLEGDGHLWSYPLAGRGTPVISNGRVFAQGYEGNGPTQEEVLVCLDEKSGKRLWEYRTRDFISDVIYSRYGLGSVTIDPETGNLFTLTSAGLVNALTPDGELLWQRSMAEDLGRLSFPNGRVGSPVIVDDLVIVHFIFAGWGKDFGPARDRFFAFHRDTGDVVWGSTPGGPPKDSSFAMPVVEERGGRTLLYAGLGGGHVACVNARTGEPVWRYPLAAGGLNSSALLYGDRLIATNGKENIGTSTIGCVASVRLDQAAGDDGVLASSAETWRNDLVAFTSSPVLVDNRVYLTDQTGELACVDADSGRVLWKTKLAPDQLHASPVAGDGKLYVPMTNGHFYIGRPSDEGFDILDQEQLAGSCLGAPAIANGRVYVHTTDRLYCFGTGKGQAPAWPRSASVAAGPAASLQLVPADVSVRQGEAIDFAIRRIDAAGRVVDEASADLATFTRPAFLTEGGTGVGVVTATLDGLTGSARVRVVPALPLVEDFEGYELDKGGKWALPPGHWLGGTLKWQIVDHDGSRVAMRRMDNPLFQRTMSLFGDTDDANYTVQADVMSEGNRRTLSSVGVINQRYQIVLKGNYQELEVSSNMERLKESVPFKWKADTWYRMKTRVDVAEDGSGVVRAKAWPRDETEPDAWTIEVTDPFAHAHGAAGLYGFTPQSRFTVYIDNLSVTPNE